jgi:hypothetical protein
MLHGQVCTIAVRAQENHASLTAKRYGLTDFELLWRAQRRRGMMPHQHVAQQFITVGELCTDALAHSPIGTAMLDTVRAIILQVRRMEEMLHQGTAHGGAEMKHALAALHTDVGG